VILEIGGTWGIIDGAMYVMGRMLDLRLVESIRNRTSDVRQLNDMKLNPMAEVFTPGPMLEYAGRCGSRLAHAHARSGEPAKISGYLGKCDIFDEAIADFAVAYADQSERDHEILVKAACAGKLEVLVEATQ